MRDPSLPARSLVVFAALTVLTATGAARAQDAPLPIRPPLLGKLFAQPTGMNGYEDFVQAGDLIQNNYDIEPALAPSAALTVKRRLLAQPNLQAAMHLLHVGMSKPIQPPHAIVDASTTFPEFSVFRRLARLLAIEMYVQFADGRVDAAIDTLDDGLRFGYRMQTNTLISGLVGIAVDAIVLKSFGPHLDQLSEYQCLRVRRLVEEVAEWPSPLPSLLRDEQQMMGRTLDQLALDPKGKEDLINQFVNEEDWDENTRLLVTHLRSNPPDIGVLVAQTKARAAVYFDAFAANLHMPFQQRKPLPSASGETLDARLFGMLVVSGEQVSHRYDQSDAMLRLLGVHAAIRAYRWEHNHLPQTLADLHIGKLALDPYTGEPLRYQNNGATYDLFSRGSAPLDDDGKPTNAPPVPVRL